MRLTSVFTHAHTCHSERQPLRTVQIEPLLSLNTTNSPHMITCTPPPFSQPYQPEAPGSGPRPALSSAAAAVRVLCCILLLSSALGAHALNAALYFDSQCRQPSGAQQTEIGSGDCIDINNLSGKVSITNCIRPYACRRASFLPCASGSDKGRVRLQICSTQAWSSGATCIYAACSHLTVALLL